MFNDILTPMNHREIEYNAKKLSGCDIPDSFTCAAEPATGVNFGQQDEQRLLSGRNDLLKWIDETGERVFDDDLVMDYGTDCLRLYLLFEQTPRENDAPYYNSWREGALEGIYKFLGKYRRMILAADAWNRCGKYNKEMFSNESAERLKTALEATDAKIRKCISRGNSVSNRHNIVAALMELLNIFQKELKIGQILISLHIHAVEMAVPREKMTDRDTAQPKYDRRNAGVTKLCQEFIILMAPYTPALSKILWKDLI
ncbi:MAG: hypothetical protein K2N73_04615 [Lachnospiraceae bacterium]|nr:hypothetical protein [Lachnospiraceae bacterium]